MKINIERINSDELADMPFEASQEHYDKAVDFIVSRWESLDQKPSSIYQIGQVGAPGISDLDFILVYSKSKPVNWQQFEPAVFPDWIQQLMTHSPYFCLESDWLRLFAWYPAFNLRHLSGNILPDPSLDREHLPGCALGMLIDYLLIKVPIDFFTFLWRRPLRIRIILALFHSLKYTARLAEESGMGTPQQMNTVIAHIDDLRNNWFKLDDKSRLELLSEQCNAVFDVVAELIAHVDKKISSMAGRFEYIRSCPQEDGGESFLKFHGNWVYNEVLDHAIKTYRLGREVEWISPESFLHVLSIYADECPALGKYLENQGCRLGRPWDGGVWDKGVRFHAKAMEAYANSLYALGIPSQKYVALGYSPLSAHRKSLWKRSLSFFKMVKSSERI